MDELDSRSVLVLLQRAALARRLAVTLTLRSEADALRKYAGRLEEEARHLAQREALESGTAFTPPRC